jgi:hypothetical protein
VSHSNQKMAKSFVTIHVFLPSNKQKTKFRVERIGNVSCVPVFSQPLADICRPRRGDSI